MNGNSRLNCPHCHKPIPADAAHGLCPRCAFAGALAATDVLPSAEVRLPPTPPPAALAPLFPQLEILGLLGRGGMGAVYKARQKELDRIVALKILPPGIGDAPAFAERFAREARALAKLNHANIVTLYEFGQVNTSAVPPEAAGTIPAGKLYYILMEFVDGMSLRQLLAGGRISPHEALAIVPQICDALQYAHDAGIVHRDIKPENVLLDRRGRVKVADFGLAKLVGAGSEPPPMAAVLTASPALTEAGRVVGTPDYMAPEQNDRPAEVDRRADIYALGVVFYQMLTGELPGQRPEAPSRKVQLDIRLDEVVLRALEKDPERRYQQVGQIKPLVEAIASQGGQAGAPPAVPPAAAGAAAPPAKSRLVRLVEAACGTRFTSSLAVWLVNLSGLGFLGCLGFLGFLSLSGLHLSWFHHFLWLFGFLGVFGLVGAALLVEFVHRRAPAWSWVVLVLTAFVAFIFLAVGAVAVVFVGRAVHMRAELEASGKPSLTPVKRLEPAANPAALADSPNKLRELPNAQLIQACLGQPLTPWGWQELGRRTLTPQEAERVMDGLVRWLQREYPAGHDQPLHWQDAVLNRLSRGGQVTDEQATRFLTALHGDLHYESGLRLREGATSLRLAVKAHNSWVHGLLGLTIMNELRAVTLDGQPLPLDRDERRRWNMNPVTAALPLPPLAPGKHRLSLEVFSALVPAGNLTGLAHDAPAAEWPQAKKQWTRTLEAELIIEPRDGIR